MTTKTFDGQTARFLASVATCMPLLPSDIMQGWIDNPKALKKALNEALCPSEEKPVAKAALSPHLVFVTSVTIPAVTEQMDPQTVLRKPHIHLWDDFEQRVLPALKPIESAPEASYTVSRLVQATSDSKTRKALPKNHLTDWHHITWLMDQQTNGEDGMLLTNSYANIFYMLGVSGEVFAVCVFWLSDGRQWRVRAWRLGGRGMWNAGRQVFSRENK